MNSALFPLRYLLVAAALWLNRQQQQVIDYLKAENRLLKAKLGDQHLHFTDAERGRLAVAAKALGRKALAQIDTLVTPDTLLRWHRQLVAQKWNFVHRRRVGRPRKKDEIVALILRMVRENPSWGYTRIMGALRNVGYSVGRGYVLFLVELTTRKVLIAGITTNPNEAWMQQIARNLVDADSGMLREEKPLIVDRDTKYCAAFRDLLKDTGTTTIRLPPRSPNLNAYAERFVGSIKAECLNRLIFVGEASLRRAIREFVAHYHAERNHQGIGNALIAANDPKRSVNAPIARRERLNGVLNCYHRQAA